MKVRCTQDEARRPAFDESILALTDRKVPRPVSCGFSSRRIQQTFNLASEVEWRLWHCVNADCFVWQKVEVGDAHPFLMRGADRPANQTHFEFEWVRRNENPRCIAP
jgi:hypothetical protein